MLISLIKNYTDTVYFWLSLTFNFAQQESSRKFFGFM